MIEMKLFLSALLVFTLSVGPITAGAPPDDDKALLFDRDGPPLRHDVPDDVIIRLPSHSHVRYQRPPSFRKSARILFWSPAYSRVEHWYWWFGPEAMKQTCPHIECEFIIDKQRLNESDVIVFMVFGNTVVLDRKHENFTRQFPAHRLPHQRWVYYTSEPPTHPTPIDQSALNGLFNWTMSFRLDSDVVAHFGKLLLNALPTIEEKRASWSRDYALGKTKLAAWFVSHCPTSGRREDYVKELQKYAKIDVYGRCGNLTCDPWQGRNCYEKLSREYKFYLSFENAISKDYVTEKFFQALVADVVPVVFGGADYSKFAPQGSFINALDFDSPAHLAEYLHSLDRSSAEYNRFFDWKRGYSPPTVNRHHFWACDLCMKALNPHAPTKVYEDMDQWWNGQSNSRNWTLN